MKIINETKILKYTIIDLEREPTNSYRRVKIDNMIFDVVPSYDFGVPCIVIVKGDDMESFIGKTIEFIL